MMHHQCSSYGNNMAGPCTCGLFHGHDQSNSFSMMFSGHQSSYDEVDYPFAYPSSSVDCTLSLGTPSTRLTSDHHQNDEKWNGSSARGGTGSNFSCWDFFQEKNSPGYPTNHKASSRGSSSGGSGGSSHSFANSDPLLARRCANCDTTSTPLWRNGPRGPKSLCNACGIRFKKEERRATAANGNATSASASGAMDHHYPYQNNSWVQAQKMPCFSPANEFRFIEDSDSDTGNAPFLSWRLNVTDRPSLIHDFTR